MKVVNASIEFLTPVHIGSGEFIGPHEYYIKDKKLYKLNMIKFISSLNEVEKTTFIDYIDRNDHLHIRTFPKEKAKEDVSELIVEVSENIQKEYEQEVKNTNNALEIYLFPYEPVHKRPYLPGSSLKGALRTPIIQMFANNNREKIEKWLERNFPKIKGNCEHDSEALDIKIRQDAFRALKIPDIPLDSNFTKIVKCLNYNPKKRKPTNSFDLRMQVTYSRISCIQNTKKYNFQFCFDEELINKANFSKKFTLQDLGNQANDYYLKVLHWEIKTFFKDKSNSPEFNILTKLQLQKNQFLIRLGRFGHVETKTLDEFRIPYNKNGWGNTRTLADNTYPMGWAIVTIEGMEFTQPNIDQNWEPTAFQKQINTSQKSQKTNFTKQSNSSKQNFKQKKHTVEDLKKKFKG